MFIFLHHIFSQKDSLLCWSDLSCEVNFFTLVILSAESSQEKQTSCIHTTNRRPSVHLCKYLPHMKRCKVVQNRSQSQRLQHACLPLPAARSSTKSSPSACSHPLACCGLEAVLQGKGRGGGHFIQPASLITLPPHRPR